MEDHEKTLGGLTRYQWLYWLEVAIQERKAAKEKGTKSQS